MWALLLPDPLLLLTFTLGLLVGAVITWSCMSQQQTDWDSKLAESPREQAAAAPAPEPPSSLPAAVDARGQRQKRERSACLDWETFWSALAGKPSRAKGGTKRGANCSDDRQRRSSFMPSQPQQLLPAPSGTDSELKEQYRDAVVECQGQKPRRSKNRRASQAQAPLRLGSKSTSNRLHVLLRSASRVDVNQDRAIWLNHFLELLWPQVAEHIKSLLLDKLEPVINSKLPALLQGSVHFKEVSLGNVAPKVYDVSVLDCLDKKMIEIRIGLNLNSNLAASIVAMGAVVSVANLILDGELSIVFGPLMPKPPYFGGLEIYFNNPPDLKLQLGGNVIPTGLKPALCSAIEGALAKFMVLPNRIAVDLNEDDDMDATDLQFTDPISVLRVTVLRAEKLVAADFNLFGARSSDPYVVIRTGATRWTSHTVQCDLNPEWSKDGKEETADLPVHSTSQLIKIQVYDADIASSDDLIGTLSNIEPRNLVNSNGTWKETAHPLLDSSNEPNAGKLYLRCRLLCLERVPPPLGKELGGPNAAYLAVKVMEVVGLPNSSLYPFTVRAVVGEAVGVTKGSHVNKNISGALEKVCIDHLKSGQRPELIASALNLKLEDVQELTVRESTGEFDRQEVRRAVQESIAMRAASNPQFQETVQLLIPDPSADGTKCFIELQLLDKKNTMLGSAKVAFADILYSADLVLTGSINLEPVGAQLLGRVSFRFLDV